MQLDKVFQAVEETQFLRKLSAPENLFFIGDLAPLKYIQDFFANHKQTDTNYYYDLSANQLEDLKEDTFLTGQYRAIVVVSMKNEATLLSVVKKQVNQTSQLPILRLFGDIFINTLCQKSLLEPTSNKTQKPHTAYAILTTPRSGSTYLCDLLDSTNIAGHPSEHLRLAVQELAKHCNFNYLTLLNNLMEYRVTNNGVFGTKLISHFLFELQQTKPNFRQVFKSIDKFILLIRKDKLAQAVSLVVAQKTEFWNLHNNEKSEKNTNYKSKLANIEIDSKLLDNVEQKYNFIHKQEARLKKVLSNNQSSPLIVVYEDILDDAELQINRILDFLAIAKPESYTMQINSGIKRMPSSISQEIIQQYQQRKSIGKITG